MKNILMGAVAFTVLSGCGGAGSSPDNNTAKPILEAPNGISCGSDFYAERSLNNLIYVNGMWSNSDQTPWRGNYISVEPSNNLTGGSYTLSTANSDCNHLAEMFGSMGADTWNTDDRAGISPGESFTYSPWFKLAFIAPDVSSLETWLNASSPETVDAILGESSLSIRLARQGGFYSVFRDVDKITTSLALECGSARFKHQLSLQAVAESSLDSLDSNYCQSVRNEQTDDVVHSCLAASVKLPDTMLNCSFKDKQVAIPRNDDTYFNAVMSGQLVQVGTDDFKIKITKATIKQAQ
ncbi:hypothetical protein [Psychrobium sp. 1_MG-2023]|uniref:hypothetical protein n=1 Tax=Psychrobium sp. 1_MG-2023 TaxID=3062624 RepID=UPI000C336CEC|nr:hypothetical protein [Psychrobium sp. 1_MG-2023]MDP2559631.1 hypothetical protein [Psychrobium sp. 1_MG-2023]PKF59464.1 hypothetical protein CW748_01450 [Alteromonadales bacterium alter-6D02]